MTAAIPPSPTVGDVITTAGELDGLPVGSVVLDGSGRASQRFRMRHQDDLATWFRTNCDFPGRTAERVLRYGPATLIHRPDAPPAAPTAGVDREALSTAVGGVLFNVMNYPEPVQAPLLGQSIAPLTAKVADAVLAFLATQPTSSSVDADASSWDCDECGVTLTRAEVTDPAARQWLASPGAEGEPDAVRHTHCPAPVDADAVERAVYDAIERHWPDAFNGCESDVTECDQGEDCAADVARAALAAARAGGVTEWGVRYEADRDTVIHEPQESEADARALVEASPTDTALVTRVVTPWVEVQR